MKITNQILILALLLSLVACGGGGGGSAATDLTPDAFSFIDQVDVALSTPTESAAITVAGINSASAISITGGEYSIDGGSYTSAAGTVSNGQSIKVRHTSSASFAAVTDTTLTIGGISDTFTTTTTVPPSLSVADASVVEGNGSATLTFIVSLSAQANGNVNVEYATTDGTAFAGNDYTAVTNTLTISSGTTSNTVTVTVNGDTTPEGDETLTLTLSSPSANATLGTSSATGTINNDDAFSMFNDTGITTCSNATTNGLTCPQTGFEGQDAESGRDVSANDDTDGHAGFSYTQLDSSGTPLATQSTDYATTPWSCVQDNVTGLIWEVKQAAGSSGLRDASHTYTWYNSTGVNNGGGGGTADGGVCFDATNCDTEKFVAAVNAAGLCGASDWRLPSREELSSLLDSSVASPGPTIDTGWFPNTGDSYYWSASPHAYSSSYAWFVGFSNGHVTYGDKGYTNYVRLVRGGQ